MAVITIGGLLTSTALTLVVVPVVYDLVDRATLGVQRAGSRVRAAASRARPGRATREGSA